MAYSPHISNSLLQPFPKPCCFNLSSLNGAVSSAKLTTGNVPHSLYLTRVLPLSLSNRDTTEPAALRVISFAAPNILNTEHTSWSNTHSSAFSNCQGIGFFFIALSLPCVFLHKCFWALQQSRLTHHGFRTLPTFWICCTLSPFSENLYVHLFGQSIGRYVALVTVHFIFY